MPITPGFPDKLNLKNGSSQVTNQYRTSPTTGAGSATFTGVNDASNIFYFTTKQVIPDLEYYDQYELTISSARVVDSQQTDSIDALFVVFKDANGLERVIDIYSNLSNGDILQNSSRDANQPITLQGPDLQSKKPGANLGLYITGTNANTYTIFVNFTINPVNYYQG